MNVRALVRLAAAGVVAVAGLSACGSGDDEGDAPRGRPQAVGSTITVGGLDYRVVIARQINPRIPPGDGLVTSPAPADSRTYFGVFLRVCNRDDRPHSVTDRFRVLGSFAEQAFEPSGDVAPAAVLPQRTLEPGECAPAPGSTADRAADGGLVLFEVPPDLLENRPLSLQVTSPDGDERRRVNVDL